MPIVDKGQVNKDAPSPDDAAKKHDPAASQQAKDQAEGRSEAGQRQEQHQGREESDAKTDLGKPLIPAEAATERGRDNPMGVKAKEGCLEKKEIVKFATLVLHDLRPQPRADEIEHVLDQLRLSDKDFKDPEAVKTEAKELMKKSRPEELEKAQAERADTAPSGAPPSPASGAQAL